MQPCFPKPSCADLVNMHCVPPSCIGGDLPANVSVRENPNELCRRDPVRFRSTPRPCKSRPSIVWRPGECPLLSPRNSATPAPVAGASGRRPPSSAPCSRPRMATRAVTYGAKTRRRLVVLVPDPVRGCGPPPQPTSGSGKPGFGAVCWCRVAQTCREWDIVCWGISSGSVSLSKLSKKTLSY